MILESLKGFWSIESFIWTADSILDNYLRTLELENFDWYQVCYHMLKMKLDGWTWISATLSSTTVRTQIISGDLKTREETVSFWCKKQGCVRNTKLNNSERVSKGDQRRIRRSRSQGKVRYFLRFQGLTAIFKVESQAIGTSMNTWKQPVNILKAMEWIGDVLSILLHSLRNLSLH